MTMDAIEGLGPLDFLDFGLSGEPVKQLEVENVLVGLVQGTARFEQAPPKEHRRLWYRVDVRPVFRYPLRRLHLAVVKARAILAMVSYEKLTILVDVQGVAVDQIQLWVPAKHTRRFPDSSVSKDIVGAQPGDH